jgi:hypothetical protein
MFTNDSMEIGYIALSNGFMQVCYRPRIKLIELVELAFTVRWWCRHACAYQQD